MRVLVVGQGGREHALVRALKHSQSVSEVYAVPGSAGMGREAVCHALSTGSHKDLCAFAKQKKVDLVVIGPEAELVSGLSDVLRSEGFKVLGPSKESARLEASKIFAKKFMVAAHVPTAPYCEVRTVEETLTAARMFQPPYVLKADGLAAGKGVSICASLKDLETAARQYFEEKVLGEAGSVALLEKFMPGWELSYLVLTNGQGFKGLPLAQDHKRLLDGDLGPNTGGMGVVAPLKVDEKLQRQIDSLIAEPTIAELKKRNMLYRGVLYIGLMITEDGPRVVEYNARWGDPEAQVILPLLDGDWGEVLLAVAEGRLPDVRWKPMCSACVVLAAPGYPGQVEKDVLIEGDLNHESATGYFLHAGSGKNKNNQWVTNGGRVLNAIGLGDSYRQALDRAYAQARRVQWRGMQMRKDIGHRFLEESSS